MKSHHRIIIDDSRWMKEVPDEFFHLVIDPIRAEFTRLKKKSKKKGAHSPQRTKEKLGGD